VGNEELTAEVLATEKLGFWKCISLLFHLLFNVHFCVAYITRNDIENRDQKGATVFGSNSALWSNFWVKPPNKALPQVPHRGDGAVTPTRLCLYTGARQDGASAVTPTQCWEPDRSAEIASAVVRFLIKLAFLLKKILIMYLLPRHLLSPLVSYARSFTIWCAGRSRPNRWKCYS